MLALNLNPAPHWIDLLPGVRAKMRPMCSAFMARAQMSADVSAAEDAADHSVAIAKAVFDAAVIEWEGVGDASGTVLPPAPAAISALLDMRAPYQAFCALYFHPWLAADAEKNGSAPLPNGTLGMAQSIAVPATDFAPTAPAA